MRYYLFDSRAWLAATVFVTLVCHCTLTNAQSACDTLDTSTVNVDVYYESLCSDSMRWIRDQLLPSYSKLRRHLNITFVPYGKAWHTRETETGPWQFLCQHGPAECRGNKAQACGIHAIQSSEATKDHQQLMVNLVGCAMRSISATVQECASGISLSEETRKLMNNCISSDFGDDLLAANGDKTHALEPPLNFVPTIIINGVHSAENQHEALNNFPKLICQYMTKDEKSCFCETS